MMNHALRAENFFETRLPNCIEGVVNISNWGFGSVFLNIVILLVDGVKIRTGVVCVAAETDWEPGSLQFDSFGSCCIVPLINSLLLWLFIPDAKVQKRFRLPYVFSCFFATACIADFHVSFASQCSSKYIDVREIRHTEKVTSRFAHSCPSIWASLPKALGTVTQDFGHPYPCTWVWKPVYVGMSVHGRGQNSSASARCLPGRGNRWH